MSILARPSSRGTFLMIGVTILVAVALAAVTGCASNAGTTSSTSESISTTTSLQTTSSASTSSTTASSTTSSASTATSGSSTSSTAAGTDTTTGATVVSANGQSINSADFSTTIDNEFMPLKPAAVFTYDGTSSDGAYKVVVTVTNDTKMIAGVTCVVVHDQVTMGGQVTEDTFDWYAQDKDGNVWYFGEDTKELDNGKVTSTAGTWEAGVDGAQPGIVMLANPQVGDSYKQEFLKGEAEDMAEVVAVNEKVTVPSGSFQNVLRIRETTPLEPGVVEEKQYAPGVGNVNTRTVKGGSEVEVLVSVTGL